MTEHEWHGYGPKIDPEQWRLAAEWLTCRLIHGGIDSIEAEAKRVGMDVTSMLVMVDACAEALHDTADRIEGGKTEEACCPDLQRNNRRIVKLMDET